MRNCAKPFYLRCLVGSASNLVSKNAIKRPERSVSAALGFISENAQLRK